MIKGAFGVVVFIIISYLLFAFTVAETNPIEWTFEARLFFSLGVGAFMFFLVLFSFAPLPSTCYAPPPPWYGKEEES